MQNCQLNGLLMDYKTNYNFISKRGHNSEILHNWKAYIICYVLHNFDDLFSFNLLSWELLIVCGWISSISHCFCDKLNQKRPKVAVSVIKSTKGYAKFQKKAHLSASIIKWFPQDNLQTKSWKLGVVCKVYLMNI